MRSAASGPGPRDLDQEVVDEPALALAVHGLADHAAGCLQRQVRDLGTDLAERALALRVDLADRLRAQSLDLRAGLRDALVAGLVGRPLRTGDDVVGLAPSLGQDGLALLLRPPRARCGRRRRRLRPCSMRSRRACSCPTTGLSAKYQASDENTRKLRALTMIQNRLIGSPASSCAASVA